MATNTAYLVGFRGHRKLIAIYGKFAALSRGNLVNCPVEFGKIYHRKLIPKCDSILSVSQVVVSGVKY